MLLDQLGVVGLKSVLASPAPHDEPHLCGSRLAEGQQGHEPHLQPRSLFQPHQRCRAIAFGTVQEPRRCCLDKGAVAFLYSQWNKRGPLSRSAPPCSETEREQGRAEQEETARFRYWDLGANSRGRTADHSECTAICGIVDDTAVQITSYIDPQSSGDRLRNRDIC